MLNALQANPADPKIGVHLHADSAGNQGLRGLQIEVQDNGAGFSAEAVKKAFVPFFTTRNTNQSAAVICARSLKSR